MKRRFVILWILVSLIIGGSVGSFITYVLYEFDVGFQHTYFQEQYNEKYCSHLRVTKENE